jgi:hypothetical protein
MEQKDFDIYEFLKGMPDGTPLYTPLCGNVEFTSVVADKEQAEAIWTEDKNGEYAFDKNGRWMKGGEVLLFPSKEMRDWSKFFKKGDVLEFAGDKGVQGTCTFEKFEDETKTRFLGRYVKEKECLYYKRASSFRTADWVKSDDPAEYIRFVEERLNGNLNRETLEIEKPKKPAFEIGKLYVFNEEDEDGDVTVIGKLIDKDESNDKLVFGKQYEIETEYFIANETFYLRISAHNELREATENEAELFNKHYSIWEKKEKEAMAQPDFKPFDKVLVRSGDSCKWFPAFFIRLRGEDFKARVNALPIHSGEPASFTSCIPYEGNESLAFTDKDFEDLPF